MTAIVGCCPTHRFWPEPNGPDLLVNGLPSGTALSYNNPRQAIREDFGTMRGDYTFRTKDSFSASYTIDDGDSLIPQADPLFGSAVLLRSQVASLHETHVLAADFQHVQRRILARGVQLRFVSAGVVSSEILSFVSGADRGNRHWGGRPRQPGLRRSTAAGPNNAANVWNRRNLFTYTDSLWSARAAIRSKPGVWFQRIAGQREHGFPQDGRATFADFADVSARHGVELSV